MTRLLALFLAVLLLLQTFSRELVVLDYQLHKERITELFCVNKDKPALHCNGKCHLAKQLRKASEPGSKAPAAGVAKVKYEVVLPCTYQLAAPKSGWRKPVCFAPMPFVPYASEPVHGIFQPPASWV